MMSHERLAINGVDSGAQPLFNETKNLVLAVNGEIYNHLDIKKELVNPSKFMTESDCEIISHLYEANPENPAAIADRLNGIFAFVLYDEAKDRYIVARDHCGIIPLYWGRDKDGNRWIASELKALHDMCDELSDFPPGHVYDSATDTLTKWYDPAWHDDTVLPTKAVVIEELRTQLVASVERQLMSEVPFGVLLSGGLDSSIISAVAQKYVQKNPGMPRLHSFSIGLEGSPDLAAAQVVADYIKTKHHSYVFTIEEGLNAYRDVIYHLETYDVTTIRAATPMFLMSRKIKTLGVKMVLSGEGADEVFGGYLYFHKCPNREEMQGELVRKVKGLYKFDCLRANKSTMAFGLEARVPFLDRQFLDYCMNDIDPTDKLCGISSKGGKLIEKSILREAFKGYLPDSVLWRQKEQFSDGVGYSWIDSIKDRAAERVTDDEMSSAKFRFPINTPPTKEAYFIRATFESFYPGRACAECVPGGPSVACSTATALKWDASFLKFADCSGRSIAGVHESAYDSTHRDSDRKTVVSEQDASKADMTFCTQIASEPAAKKVKL